MVIDQYGKKIYDKVVVVYTDFKSAIAQTAKLKQVLLISKLIWKMLTELGLD